MKDHGTAGLQELSRRAAWGLSPKSDGHATARILVMQTPIMIWILINHPVQENWFHTWPLTDAKVVRFYFFNNHYLWKSVQHECVTCRIVKVWYYHSLLYYFNCSSPWRVMLFTTTLECLPVTSNEHLPGACCSEALLSQELWFITAAWKGCRTNILLLSHPYSGEEVLQQFQEDYISIG